MRRIGHAAVGDQGWQKLKMRSDDPAYLELVDRWWSVLLPKIGRFLVERGGNILMVQVDHLYSCDALAAAQFRPTRQEGL